MYGMTFAAYFQKFVESILSQYSRYLPLKLTTSIGFDGTTASQRVTVFTPQIDADALLFGANVDFSNTAVTAKITDTASGYVWNPVSATPIVAIAGVTTQVSPILPLVCPFFLSRQSKLQMDFVNSPTSLTTGGNITWDGLKLIK
jgi:hypothetical protein